MYQTNPPLDDVLEHHGIKGQKWGVRRFQNEDGSLTSAGYKRYNVDVDAAKKRVADAKEAYKQESKRYNQATKGGLVYDEAATKQLIKASQKMQWEKAKFSDEKVKEKLNQESDSVSKHRQKLIDGYLKQGMSQEEAEIAAYKRARTEKIIAATAALTIAAATAYVAKNAYEKRVDQLIPEGTLLQNISTDSNKGVQDAFYASMTNMDNHKYRGIYGQTLSRNGENSVYETKIGIKGGLKLASEKSGVSVLSELVNNDKSYAKDLETHLKNSVGRYQSDIQNRTIAKGLESLRKGKVDANVYNALNLSLTDHNLSTSDRVSKGLYGALKSKGYDAIMDFNDKKISGYKSSKPIIVFNGAAKTFVQNRREVLSDEMTNSYVKAMGDIKLKSLTPYVAMGAASLGLVAAGNSSSRKASAAQRNQIVAEYKKEHPGTQLSNDEILENYYNS